MSYIQSLLRKCKTLAEIKVLQCHLFTTGLFHHPPSRSNLLNHCATTSSSGTLPFALRIFASIPPPGPTTNDFNAIIRGHSTTTNPLNALCLFISMFRAEFRAHARPDALTCSFTLKACARALAHSQSVQVHTLLVKLGVLDDLLLQTTLLDAYAKCGDLGFARKVFDEILVRDVACWNALILGLAQGDRPKEALELFWEMREPNEVSVLGALSACSQLGAVSEGEKVYECVRLKGLDDKVNVCNAVIDMYAKCGLVEKACGVFDAMRCSRNTITWNTMIMAFAMHGEGVRALELFDRMEEEGIRADEISYLAALCACNHAGMVDKGMKLFKRIDEVGVVKTVKHYGSMVDLLGRAGRLNEAYEMSESMPMTPDVVLWQTLLGACKTYGNTELAEKASAKLVEMGSNSDGDFVLLSNIYAAQGRWKDVGRVRDTMKMRDVKKVPGFSYIELGGQLYKFINGDRSHPRNKEIYEKLDEIRVKIKEYGYTEETSYVLHDIGQEEKEHALSFHSEKLAVAFGLISTSEGSLISVNKNLRICGDCHEVMKLISNIYNREIIVRDRTRFHRFKTGSCSCKDYW